MLCNGSIWQLVMLCIWGWGNYCRLSMQQRPADQTRLSGQIMKMIQALSIDTIAMTRPFHKAMLFDAIWCCSGEDIHITEIAMSLAVTSTRLFRKLLPVKNQARSRVSASMANYDCSLFASHSTRVCKSISSYFSEGLRKQQMNKNKVQKWGSELKRTSFLDPTIGSFWAFGSFLLVLVAGDTHLPAHQLADSASPTRWPDRSRLDQDPDW